MRAKLEREQQQRSKNSLDQVENFIRLQAYMGGDILMPEMHAWPISPDLGVLLIRLVEATAYDSVIEFGSGVSTLILAHALHKTAARQQRTPAPFLSVEHLEQYRDQTAAQLQQAGLRDRVDLCLTPLKPYQAENGNTYPYYTIQTALQQLARQRFDNARVLVLVDGPPAATGPQARYPALPLLLDSFPASTQFDILTNDYMRDDERAIVALWEAECHKRMRPCAKQEYTKMEKQACLLQIEGQVA
ncbi:hypothetical protein CKO36_13120 [Rhabdochromatium marinum]|nr:hypothetical protein [Rhabdochromatium marinum]